MKSSKKVFLGTQEIAAYYVNLYHGLREEGVRVSYACVGGQGFGYGIEELKANKAVWNYYQSLNANPAQSSVIRLIRNWIKKLNRLVFIIWAVLKHDTFVFGFGTSLLPGNADIKILKKLGKKVICNMMHGSELRPPYLNGTFLNAGAKNIDWNNLMNYTHFLSKRAGKLEEEADVVIAGPYNFHFLKQPFINHFHLGLPFRGDETSIDNRQNDGESTQQIKILHAPSNPIPKGSPEINSAITELIQEGHKIDFVELTGRSHEDVLKEIRSCDFIIDQVYSDTPMAGLATEGAWYGKPAIVCGLDLNEIQKHIPEGKVPPTLICLSENLKSAIEELLGDKERRRSLGLAASEFLCSEWYYRRVAKRYIEIFENRIPKEWMLSPHDCHYLFGYGVNRCSHIHYLNQWKQLFGEEGFCLDHNPHLKQEIIKLINNSTQVN